VPWPPSAPAGDGHDSIDNATELQTVLDQRVARIKVVRVINYCGSPGTNIIGCSYTPGFGMAVVRVSSNEGLLWLHEYGHNAGLDHVNQSNNVMYPFLVGTALGLNQTECNALHAPPPLTQASPQDVGTCGTQATCTDRDADGYGNPGSSLCPAGSATDCNDTNANVNPGKRDLCNGVDNDCNGRIDDDAVCSVFDVNGDGRVSGAELAWIGRAFGACSATQAWWSKADYDRDGCVGRRRPGHPLPGLELHGVGLHLSLSSRRRHALRRLRPDRAPGPLRRLWRRQRQRRRRCRVLRDLHRGAVSGGGTGGGAPGGGRELRRPRRGNGGHERQ
jgi:hypothetical protein